MDVTTVVECAGQLVTEAAQEVMVNSVVTKTVEVVSGTPPAGLVTGDELLANGVEVGIAALDVVRAAADDVVGALDGLEGGV